MLNFAVGTNNNSPQNIEYDKMKRIKASLRLISGVLFISLLLPLYARRNPQPYFAKALERAIVPDASLYGKRLRAGDVEKTRAELWQQWCQSVSRHTDQSLIPLAPLKEKRVGVLRLPDSLDTAGLMQYYWGSKGDIQTTDSSRITTFLCLHGSGDNDPEWEANYNWACIYDDAPSRHFIPRSPLGGTGCRWFYRSKQWAWRWLWLQLTTQTPGIDPNRIAVYGISEGGYGSQRLASFYADYLCAAGPMAGGELLHDAPCENLWHTPLSLLTGEKDHWYNRARMVKLLGTQLDSLQYLHPDGYVHRVELVPGMGHGINYRPTTPWLRQFRRVLHPRVLAWEDYAMHGQRRLGFYNIGVKERPKDTDRLRWDMEICDNTVWISIRRLDLEPQWQDSTYGVPMTLSWKKTYHTATGGRFTLFLGPQHLDLSRPVKVIVNGHRVYYGRLRPNRRWMLESLATYLDPMRIYAYGLDLSF